MAKVSRRKILQLGALGAAAPLLQSTRLLAQGEAGDIPNRLVVFFSPNGFVPDDFAMPGGTFQTSFEPLQPWADRTLMLDGLDMRSSEGDAHQGGVALLLSGEPWVPKADNPTKAETGGGITIDRHLARTLAAPTPIDSFNFGARSFGTGVQHVLSYDGPRLPLAPEPDPGRAWDVLFGDFTPPGDPAAEA
ncbi:MAG: DUF1552 domain-containing protein, partial [Myxococcota bacterium]